MEIAFRHHAWATRARLDLCRALTPEQLELSPTGVYGGILDTLRHIVGADRWYLHGLNGQHGDIRAHRPDSLVEEATPLEDVVRVADQNATDWVRLLPSLHPNAEVVTERLEGGARRARVDVRLAQALYHGTDHRSQVDTILTVIGVPAPSASVWDFAVGEGLVILEP